MSQVVVLRSKDFLVSLLVLEKLNEADSFCQFCRKKFFKDLFYVAEVGHGL